MHYSRWQRTGSPHPALLPARGLTVKERFESNVIRRGPDECWGWKLKPNAEGYSTMFVGGRAGSSAKAYRIAYELFIGPVPDGMVLDHTCHNADTGCAGRGQCPHRQCVNPFHLEAVTPVENTRRGRETVTHCPKGHEYTLTNSYYDGTAKYRRCRECRRAQGRSRDARKRAPAA